MRVEYRNEIRDLVAFSQFHHRTTQQTPKAALKGGATFLLLFSVMFALTGDLNVRSFVGLVVAAVLWVAVFRVLSPRLVDWSTRRLYAPGKNKAILGWHSLDLGEGMLREQSEGGAQDQRYDAIERVEETSTHVFIYLSGATAHIVPKSTVAQGDLPSFVTELRKRLAAAVEPAVVAGNPAAGTSV